MFKCFITIFIKQTSRIVMFEIDIIKLCQIREFSSLNQYYFHFPNFITSFIVIENK